MGQLTGQRQRHRLAATPLADVLVSRPHPLTVIDDDDYLTTLVRTQPAAAAAAGSLTDATQQARSLIGLRPEGGIT